ncbi:MAG: SGNH/GDSL hydrolase family protein [Congregibacter sp.]|nr:SGNH/GDSL hydrolase family protein [Congregibacter sp.]MDP5069680.1 SGNH/GDSL hydrolase family protein [Congregibacter sp.]
MRAVMALGIACFMVLAAYNAAIIVKALYRGSELARASEAFTRSIAEPGHTLLVVGDSTAVGTGANSPKDSIAGRIAAEFPQTAVFNFAMDGALTNAVPGQIAQAPQGPYDLVLIQVGGNDALRFTSRETLREAIEKSLHAATALGRNTLLISVGDLGESPAVPWPLSLLFSQRSRLVRDVFKAAADDSGVAFLDLMAVAKDKNPFQSDPDRYYAADKLHPASAGYAVWYQSLRRSVPLGEWLGSPDA